MTRRLGVAVVLAAVVAAIVGPWLVPYDPAAQQLSLRLAGPTWQHPFGLDELGRDVLARLLVGARVSLLVGIAVVSISASIGIVVGAVTGYAGGWLDALMGRAMDILLAFPGILLAIALGGARTELARRSRCHHRMGELRASRPDAEGSRARLCRRAARWRAGDRPRAGTRARDASGHHRAGDACMAGNHREALSFLGLGSAANAVVNAARRRPIAPVRRAPRTLFLVWPSRCCPDSPLATRSGIRSTKTEELRIQVVTARASESQQISVGGSRRGLPRGPPAPGGDRRPPAACASSPKFSRPAAGDGFVEVVINAPGTSFARRDRAPSRCTRSIRVSAEAVSP